MAESSQSPPVGEGGPLLAARGTPSRAARAFKAPQTNIVIALIAGGIGCFLEWYAFALFGVFADELACTFFPVADSVEQAYLESFVLFGSAFIMRPLGGFVIGWIGDRYGRVLALQISITMLAIPSALVGMLPGYAVWGWWSPALLFAIRMLQGLFVGGEVAGSVVYVLELAPKEHQALAGAVLSVASSGQLLASGISTALRATLTPEQMHAWGWRAPWFLCILLAVAGCGLRCCLDETPAFEASKAKEATRVAIEGERTSAARRARCAMSGARTALIVAALALWHTGFYVIFTWLPSFMLSMRAETALAELTGARGANVTELLSAGVENARLCGGSALETAALSLGAVNTTRRRGAAGVAAGDAAAMAALNGGVWNQPHSWTVSTCAFVAFGIAMVLGGWLSDRVEAWTARRIARGRCPRACGGVWIQPVVSALAVVLLAPLCLYRLGHAPGENIDILAWALTAALAVFYAVHIAPLPSWFIKVLPDPSTRFTVLGLGYNVGSALFAGGAPLVATTITKVGHSAVYAGVYLSIVSLVSAVAMATHGIRSARAKAAAL